MVPTPMLTSYHREMLGNFLHISWQHSKIHHELKRSHNKCIHSEIMLPSYTLHHCSNTRSVRIRVWVPIFSGYAECYVKRHRLLCLHALGFAMTNDTTKCLTNCRTPSSLATCKMSTLLTHEFVNFGSHDTALCCFQTSRRPENNSHAPR